MIEISNPEKVLFPESKIDKEEIVRYYSKISDKMLKFLKDRPLAFQRFPNGIQKKGFFQKNTPDYYPDSIKRVKIKGTEYSVCNSKAGLEYLANQACLVIHTWMSNVDDLDKPDKVVFDLDPPKDSFVRDVAKGARGLKELLEHLGLKPFVMSTGSKGLHIVVPIRQELGFDKVREVAGKIAEIIIKTGRGKFTGEQIIKKRGGKIFVDVNRNSRAQLAVAPFSMRAIEGAPVAVPLEWKDVKEDFEPKDITIRNVDSFLEKRKGLWDDFFKSKRSFKKVEGRVDGLLTQV